MLPAAKAMTKNLFSEQHANDVSENTVKRGIDEMAQNMKDILLERLRHSEYFALQLDESHDVSNNANLVAFEQTNTKIKFVKSLCSVNRCLFIQLVKPFSKLSMTS
jgi:hypothetical protein